MNNDKDLMTALVAVENAALDKSIAINEATSPVLIEQYRNDMTGLNLAIHYLELMQMGEEE